MILPYMVAVVMGHRSRPCGTIKTAGGTGLSDPASPPAATFKTTGRGNAGHALIKGKASCERMLPFSDQNARQLRVAVGLERSGGGEKFQQAMEFRRLAGVDSNVFLKVVDPDWLPRVQSLKNVDDGV